MLLDSPVLRVAAAAVAGLLAAPVARADLIVSLDGTATPQAGGYAYSYTLTNLSTADELVFDLSLTVNPATTLSGVTAPPGWEVTYNPGDSAVEWDAIPAGFLGFDNILPPGRSLTFSYFSPDGPGPTPFTVQAFVFNPQGPEGFPFDTVQVEGVVTPRLGAAPVPGPATLAVFVLGGCCLLGRLRGRPDRTGG